MLLFLNKPSRYYFHICSFICHQHLTYFWRRLQILIIYDKVLEFILQFFMALHYLRASLNKSFAIKIINELFSNHIYLFYHHLIFVRFLLFYQHYMLQVFYILSELFILWYFLTESLLKLFFDFVNLLLHFLFVIGNVFNLTEYLVLFLLIQFLHLFVAIIQRCNASFKFEEIFSCT